MHSKKQTKLYGRKALVLACALTMAATAGVGGTVAWLITKTDQVVNTFTYGDIDITLEETDTNTNPDTGDQGDGDNDPNTNTYEMVPGTDIKKDPKITVEGDSEACWLFVELTESENFEGFLSYEISEEPDEYGNKWTALEGVENVYYRETVYSADDQAFAVLAGNKVTVSADVTKEQLNALDEGETYPTLSVAAYAVQRASIDDVQTAWTLAKGE